jgi:hypothetical protein
MTRKEVIRMAGDAGFYLGNEMLPYFERFAEQVAKTERKSCEHIAYMMDPDENKLIAVAIRARGET